MLHTWSLEHVQHALCNEETATNVDARDECRCCCKVLDDVSRVISTAHQDHPTDSSDARDSIGDWHQWGVQRRCHTPHSMVAYTQSVASYHTDITHHRLTQLEVLHPTRYNRSFYLSPRPKSYTLFWDRSLRFWSQTDFGLSERQSDLLYVISDTFFPANLLATYW